MWIGGLIGCLDRRFNSATVAQNTHGLKVDGAEGTQRLAGSVALLVMIGIPAGLALLVQAALLRWLPYPLALLLLAVGASSLLAQRSLHAHVGDVVRGLQQHGLNGGREAVGHIVGRSTGGLDEPAIVRAAIESLAENFSDGVVAPLFWCSLMGLPGIVGYKAINTADSMIGHLTPRHRLFGWAAARLDDLVNLPASRLAAFWIMLAAGIDDPRSWMRNWRIVQRDARRHRSPNAGWPEAAMAAALGIRLAGPRLYGTVLVDDGWIGDGNRNAGIPDLRRALLIYRRACIIQGVVVVLMALLIFQMKRG